MQSTPIKKPRSRGSPDGRTRLKHPFNRPMEQNEGLANIDTKFIVLSVVFSLFLSPITFQLVKSDKSATLMSDVTASLITLACCLVVIFVAHAVLRQHYQLEQLQVRLKPKSLIDLFSSPTKQRDDNNDNVDNRRLRDAKSSPNKRRIDPKYFKPRFILNELMSMWGTTYTVITWGSVWVVGGTIIAGEKLAHKIKTKCAREGQSQAGGTRWSGSSGRQNSYDSQYSQFTDGETDDDATSNTANSNNKSSLKRLSSWTRKSYASAKKKWNKFRSGGALQITTGSPNRSR